MGSIDQEGAGNGEKFLDVANPGHYAPLGPFRCVLLDQVIVRSMKHTMITNQPSDRVHSPAKPGPELIIGFVFIEAALK